MSEVTESILFRQKLYENFKQSGMLSKLKTSLRVNLLQKLQKPLPAQISQSKQQYQKSKPLYLRDKFLACIALQYLRKSGKQYSFSILLPESCLEEQDCLNYNELAEIINVQNPEQNHKSFLQTLVQQWTKFRATEVRQRSTQTDYSDPMSKKLQDIDKKYRPQMDYWKLIPNTKENKDQASGDMPLLAKQQRMKEEFQLEKKRTKRQLEAIVRAELEKKFQDKYSTRLKQVQKAHEGRLFELKNREKTVLDGLQRKKKDLQLKSRQINDDEMKMIKKYEHKIDQLQLEHKRKMKELQKKQKQFWQKELQLKAKKRQYQDTIRLVKQKVVEETMNT